jgi:hypothetical protein
MNGTELSTPAGTTVGARRRSSLEASLAPTTAFDDVPAGTRACPPRPTRNLLDIVVAPIDMGGLLKATRVSFEAISSKLPTDSSMESLTGRCGPHRAQDASAARLLAKEAPIGRDAVAPRAPREEGFGRESIVVDPVVASATPRSGAGHVGGR